MQCQKNANMNEGSAVHRELLLLTSWPRPAPWHQLNYSRLTETTRRTRQAAPLWKLCLWCKHTSCGWSNNNDKRRRMTQEQKLYGRCSVRWIIICIFRFDSHLAQLPGGVVGWEGRNPPLLMPSCKYVRRMRMHAQLSGGTFHV